MLNLRGYGWMLWQGLELTILVGLGAMTLALVLGLLGAWGKLSRARAGRWIAHGGRHGAGAFRRVVLPQMWRFALPGLGNVWMVLIKATALISVIQLDERMRSADIAARATRLPFTFFFAASLFYLGITIVSMLVQRRAEAWANRGVRGGSRSAARPPAT